MMCLSQSLERFSITELYFNQTEAELLVQNFSRLRFISSDCQLDQVVVSFFVANEIEFEKLEEELPKNENWSIVDSEPKLLLKLLLNKKLTFSKFRNFTFKFDFNLIRKK